MILHRSQLIHDEYANRFKTGGFNVHGHMGLVGN